MLRVIIDEPIDLASSNWIRSQAPAIDAILGCIDVSSFGIEDGKGWIEIRDEELPKLHGLACSVHVKPPVLPEIFITSLATDNPASIIAPDFCDITCPAGTKISVVAELRSPDGAVISVDDTFRMPMTSSDGRTRYILVTMKAGIVSFSTVISEGGLWTISQNGINSALPPEKHMTIKDIKIYVCI